MATLLPLVLEIVFLFLEVLLESVEDDLDSLAIREAIPEQLLTVEVGVFVRHVVLQSYFFEVSGLDEERGALLLELASRSPWDVYVHFDVAELGCRHSLINNFIVDKVR